MDTKIDIAYLKRNNLILFEVISGSQAYGLATPESDTDIKGVFYLPKEMFYANLFVDQVSNESNDIVYYEIGKYIELLVKNNPNILELLCTPEQHVLYKHPLMDRIKPADFLSKLAKETFAGYAMTQVKKAKGLNKKFNNPVAEERLIVLDFCFILSGKGTVPLSDWLSQENRKQEFCGLVKLDHTKGLFALYYEEHGAYKGIVKDETSNELRSSPVGKDAALIAYLFFNQEAYTAHCKRYAEYWAWVEKRNEHRYKGNQEHGKGYDAKNMMHTIRLLQEAKELFATGVLNVARKNREGLLSIKRGEKSYEELLDDAEKLMAEIEHLSAGIAMIDKPDEANAKQTLVEIREYLYSNCLTV